MRFAPVPNDSRPPTARTGASRRRGAARPDLVMSIAKWTLVGAIAGWLGWKAIDRFWLAPRADLLARIAREEGSLSSYRQAKNDTPTMEKRIGAFTTRTLGGDEELVDHQLRTHLNRIVAEVGLREPVVSTGATTSKRSPAQAAMPRSGDWKALRDEPDFVELEGSVSGQGDFAQCLELVDRIESEPWLKRLTQVRFDPRDNGQRFQVSVRLVTLFVPGRFDPAQQVATAYDPARLSALFPLAERNPFRLPPPPEPPPVQIATTEPAPAPPPPAPPRPSFPWGEWQVTGVADAGGAPEAWLRNTRTGETRRLGVGESISEASLVAIEPEAVRLALPDGEYRVELGDTLARRRRARG